MLNTCSATEPGPYRWTMDGLLPRRKASRRPLYFTFTAALRDATQARSHGSPEPAAAAAAGSSAEEVLRAWTRPCKFVNEASALRQGQSGATDRRKVAAIDLPTAPRRARTPSQQRTPLEIPKRAWPGTRPPASAGPSLSRLVLAWILHTTPPPTASALFLSRVYVSSRLVQWWWWSADPPIRTWIAFRLWPLLLRLKIDATGLFGLPCPAPSPPLGHADLGWLASATIAELRQ
ncbi:hypothetical protein BS78_09G084500 [Paspalum vaginatum]|nr:hypothetical protein BS78_09G084500 [Paspalum vaginatum]